MQIRRIQRQRTNLSKAKKHLKISKDIFNNKISKKNISKKVWSTKKCACKYTKKKGIIWKRIKENSKIFHKMNLIRLRLCMIYHEMSLNKLQK